MAASNEELARALEAMSSGQADAQPEQQEDPALPSHSAHPAPPAEPSQPEPTPAARVSHAIRPLPGKPVAPAPAPARGMQQRSPDDRGLTLRRTIIPPLLTLGTLMPLMGVASLIMGEESPLGEQPLVPALLILVGLLILGMAALNMLQVRHLLSASAKR